MFLSVIVILIFNSTMVIVNSFGRETFNLTLLSNKTEMVLTVMIIANACLSFLFEKLINKFA